MKKKIAYILLVLAFFFALPIKSWLTTQAQPAHTVALQGKSSSCSRSISTASACTYSQMAINNQQHLMQAYQILLAILMSFVSAILIPHPYIQRIFKPPRMFSFYC